MRIVHTLTTAILYLNYAIEALVTDVVTCGSTTKLLQTTHNVRLHSHDVKYGSGSGQQSVTAVPNMDDHNSHWQIVGCPERGTPVECGSKIQLLHVSTGCRLHSHLFTSPLSRNQEVSCFEGEDSGDNWEVICNDDFWHRQTEVKFKHVDTGTFLSVPGHKYGRPIAGQMEVATTSSSGHTSSWKAAEGIFVMPTESQEKKYDF